MPEKSLKTQAEEIMVAVDRDLQQLDTGQSSTALTEVDSRANALMNTLFNVVSDVDIEAAAERVEQLKEKLSSFLIDNGEISTPQFKEMIGASRKYVIPLLEFFDSTNFTIRVGDMRQLRKRQ